MGRGSPLPTRRRSRTPPTRDSSPTVGWPQGSDALRLESVPGSPHKPCRGLPPQSNLVSCPFASPNFPTSLSPCSGPDDCPRTLRALWENPRHPALTPPALAYNRAAYRASSRAWPAGCSPPGPRNRSRSDRRDTAYRRDETSSSLVPPARARWIPDGDGAGPDCDTGRHRPSGKSLCPQCRPGRCYESNRAWHARTGDRADGSGSWLHSTGRLAPPARLPVRSRSTPIVPTSDARHERLPPRGRLRCSLARCRRPRLHLLSSWAVRQLGVAFVRAALFQPGFPWAHRWE